MAGEEVAPGPAQSAQTAQSAQSAPGSWGQPSSRTITWHDPQITAAGISTMTGLDALKAMQAGTFPPPPIMGALGIALESVAPGEAVFVCTPDQSVYNPIGVVHGGLVCTMLDSALACAVHTTLPAGVGYTSIDLTVSYLRPIHAGMQLRARGWVVKPGRRVAFGAADVRDGDDKVVATATGSCLVMS
jgi:uncharacterized protein (TIGR00369 family)